MASLAKRVRILQVEDNPADVCLLKEAFAENGFPCDVSVAEDGSKALDLLRSGGANQNLASADLIILDLNLPKSNGLSVLAEIKKEPRLLAIPIIVLSTSRAHGDITEARKLGAIRYLSKASNFAGMLVIARQIEDLWRATGDAARSV